MDELFLSHLEPGEAETLERIFTRLGGRLSLESAPGNGTRIQMILPRVAPLEQAAE